MLLGRVSLQGIQSELSYNKLSFFSVIFLQEMEGGSISWREITEKKAALEEEVFPPPSALTGMKRNSLPNFFS